MAFMDEEFNTRVAVSNDLFANKILTPLAAERSASISLSGDTTIEGCIGRLWQVISIFAREHPEHQGKLVDVLVDLSKLPDAISDQGEPLVLYGMQVWKDLPMLGWEFRDDWNATVPIDSPEDRQRKAILNIVNLSRFNASLMATEEPVFNYSLFALWVFRTALETPPIHQIPGDSLDAYVPAAAAWIEILGVEIYEWDEEFNAAGSGGPLWKGKRGFCQSRWRLWRERFGESARAEGELGGEARAAAIEAEVMMKEIEDGEVE